MEVPINPVRTDALWVVQNGNKQVSVTVESEGPCVRTLVEVFQSNPPFLASKHDIARVWTEGSELNPREQSLSTLSWIFLVDTLNFSFWNDDGTPVLVQYNEQVYSGYWALCAAVNRALDEFPENPITCPRVMADESKITPAFIAQMFRTADGKNVPLLEERRKAILEAGTWICEKFEGSVGKMVESCCGSALRLSLLVSSSLESYSDQCELVSQINPEQKKIVCFNKRAQILAADIWTAFGGNMWGDFKDIYTLTMFADYRVPQMLAHIEAIAYTDALVERLERNQDVPHGSWTECEIRAASILAVDKLCEVLKYKGYDICPVELDFWLWKHAKEIQRDAGKEMDAVHAGMSVPIHRTRCIYY